MSSDLSVLSTLIQPVSWLVDLGLNVPPTAKVIYRRYLVIQTGRSPKSNLRLGPLVYKASDITIAPRRLLVC